MAPSASRSPVVTTGRRRALGLFSAATVAVGSVVLTSGVAQAALPQLPNNIVVFPNRDFMTVEGFEGLPAGSTATVKVFRGTTVVGQTTAPVAYPEDGVAFEINHPGGACWGEGAPAGLDVTPDITGGDRVELTINGQVFDMPVADIEVATETRDGATVTVVSNVPAAIPMDRLEARIIQPDLKDTAVGRRDARAVADGTGDDGYTSTLVRSVTDPDQVVATYTFLDEATARTALAGTSRIMSWAAADGDERSGITIAEHEEVGGPGLGGCPAGPGDAAQPGPGQAGVVRAASGQSMTVNWAAAPDVAGSATPVNGYQVTLTDTSGNIIGKKVGVDVLRADFTGLTATMEYLVEVRAASGTGADTVLSKPFAAPSGAPDQNPETGDVTNPTVTLARNAETGAITVTADETVDVYYTLDGSDVVDIDMPAVNAIHLAAGQTIPVTVSGTLVRVAAFDAAGNIGTAEGTFEPGSSGPAPTLPGAPGNVRTTAGQGSLTVEWDAPAPTDAPAISRYEVTATPATGTAVSAVVVAPATSATLTGLTAGTAYTVSVVAVNGQGSSPAGTTTGTPNAVTNDQITITGGRYRAGDRLEVTGTGTLGGAVISIRTGSETGPVIGTAIVANPAVGATTGQWNHAVRNAVPTVPGSQVWATSDKGGKAGPFVLRR
ncbi:fibronectin type III domain-containing protein [Geodermatophilus sabuli]|uniref:Fibronectin type III domain-containing protein n=1 Tax=Geodermatophilus sabuli TaxID=1564158 RepID=A0A285EAJ0_9ACTN|nr:fibronectin type III domain-containing protein [Geodermatophilus sabuli]MBB3081894.1 hypothetical protein [Geodermatophilus sabuli]SNX95234.1 Fibronectin type III domain-containing protein [Geodermatophilus sabuli]